MKTRLETLIRECSSCGADWTVSRLRRQPPTWRIFLCERCKPVSSLRWEAERLNFQTDRFCGWPQILRYFPCEGTRAIARDTLVMAIEEWLVMRS